MWLFINMVRLFFQHCLEIYPEPFTISFDPNSYVIPPLPFPHAKSTSQPVTDAFVNIIIPVQNNLSSQVPHPGPRRTIIPRNTKGQPSIFQNNRSHRNIFHPVIKPLLERDLYHRTITSHFKRHKIYGYRRTGLHAGI